MSRRVPRRGITTTVTRVLRAGFLYRVSSDEQAERGTIEAQRIYLHDRYRADMRDDAPATTRIQLVAEYTDDGVSGAVALDQRPGGKQLLADARAGLIDVVIVYKLDRLGRSARVLLDAHDELERYGVAIVSATEPFDTRPGPMQAIGRFVFQLLASIAELERSTIRTRTMNGKHRLANAGRFVNGKLPFGYVVDANECLVPSQIDFPGLGMTESEVITSIFERVAGGESCYAVAESMNALGVLTPPARMFNKRKQSMVAVGKQSSVWERGQVARLIRNESYKGSRTLNFEERTVNLAIPALVDDITWQRANAVVSAKAGRKASEYVYLLSGKLRCTATMPDGSECGLLFTGGLSGDRRYYSCNGSSKEAARHRNVRCGALRIRAQALEQEVWDDVKYQAEHANEIGEQVRADMAGRDDAVSGIRRRHDALKLQKEQLEVARRALRDQRARGLGDIEEIEEDLTANGEHLVATTAQLEELEALMHQDNRQDRILAETISFLIALKDEIADVERRNDRQHMRQIINRVVASVSVLDATTIKPRFDIQYSFRSHEATSSAALLHNIATELVMFSQPQERVRMFA